MFLPKPRKISASAARLLECFSMSGFQGLSRKNEMCFKIVLSGFQCFNGASRVFKGCLKGVSRKFQDCLGKFQFISREFQEVF